jgi:hypothetical protein
LAGSDGNGVRVPIATLVLAAAVGVLKEVLLISGWRRVVVVVVVVQVVLVVVAACPRAGVRDDVGRERG